jgi:transcriptional regulator with XRE-family HTH domain
MGRNLDEVISSLPAARQEKIAALAEKKVEEMIALAATLTDFRKAVGKTQVEVAAKLGIKQNAVSQLEKRSDTYVSTLRKYLQSLDITLELSAVSKNGTRIALSNFHPWDDPAPPATARGTAPATTSTPTTAALKGRRPAVKKATLSTVRAKAKPGSAEQPAAIKSKVGAAKKQRTAFEKT